MYNLDIRGTTSQKLLDYVGRVYSHLGLDEFEECLFDVDFKPRCDGDAGGYCNADDGQVFVELARSDSEGRIPMEDLMVNIAHEMVHAKQMASGRLINNGFVLRTNDEGDTCLTTKQTFDGVEYVSVAYKDHPWEQEAYGTEREIYLTCK